MENLFWPVYKNLEKEIIDLSFYIHFCDENLDVYSIKIADLLLRCSIEIESISKELYYRNGGDKAGKVKFDYDCLKFLIENWALDKKEVHLKHDNFFFKEHLVNNPLPFVNVDKGVGCKWKEAYQAVKHNRINDISKASLKNLLAAISALYILNLYFRYDKIPIRRGMDKNIIEFDFGSNMFFQHICTTANYTEPDGYGVVNDMDKYIFLQRYHQNDFAVLNKIENEIYSQYGIVRKVYAGHEEFIDENSMFNDPSFSAFISRKVDYAIQDFYLEIFTNKKRYS